MIITESLREYDLKDLVDPVFEIDSYKSKIGDDEDIIVLSFTIKQEDPAKDLENFIEMGYEYVLDADVSPGETDDGTYKLFVEIERNRHSVQQILDLLENMEKLTGMSDMRFRYFKSFKSHDANKETLTNILPLDKESYMVSTEHNMLENFSNFFNKSFLESVESVNESIKFKKIWADPIYFKVIDSGNINNLYESITGHIMLESKDMAEVLFLTKYIGDYNITKISNKTFIFENNNYGVIMEQI